ncbi:VOC family protein [Streptomyces bicolor]|uniref:VOC family protein n=1 Tax=Streptomyces bicolor TaxID=66874 RepID=UPI00131B7E9C|nr:VOC family protein [Streptomyces bicolor]
MVATVANVSVDCANAYQLARFWSEVTGQPLDREDEPGDDETEIMLPGGPALHFNEVPEGSRSEDVTNRACARGPTRTARGPQLRALLAQLGALRPAPGGGGGRGGGHGASRSPGVSLCLRPPGRDCPGSRVAYLLRGALQDGRSDRTHF